MASYVVMEPPARGEKDGAVLVRDGFHFFAFLVPAVWLLFHRLWIEAVIALAAAVAVGMLGNLAGLGTGSSVLSLLVGLYMGMEGAALKVAALRRRGWHEWGVVEAENPRDAEIRYLERVFDTDDDELAPAASVRPSARESRHSGPALGMLGYPGRG